MAPEHLVSPLARRTTHGMRQDFTLLNSSLVGKNHLIRARARDGEVPSYVDQHTGFGQVPSPRPLSV